MAEPAGRRVDPADGKAYSFAEISAVYKGQYSPGQIRAYWNSEMRPVESAGLDTAGTSEENRKIDPDDGQAYTFSGLTTKYSGQYSVVELREYWRISMRPIAAGTPSAASAAPRPAGGGPAAAGTTPGAAGGEGSSLAEPPTSKAGGFRASFCPDPKTIGQKFTLTYDKEPIGNFASVNPGDQGLRVGGGTLNGQFQKDLYNFGWQETEKYGPYHNRLFGGVEPLQFARASKELLSLNPNLMAGFVFKASDGGKVGTVFVDVFRNEVRVHGNSLNMAMVYTVGPKRQDCPSDQAFLAQVEATAHNVGLACTEYNALAGAEGFPQIEVLRFPLVSGGAFAGRCPKDAVAAALLRGLIAGCGADSPEMNFAFDGDIFRQTWEAMNTGA
uniref:Uncharacterized protein n=1 Tax=Pyrodinium bahamense TaxID=73915 RepID=A0A7S0FLL1_9DINO